MPRVSGTQTRCHRHNSEDEVQQSLGQVAPLRHRPTTSSSSRAQSFFDAVVYAFAYLVVISVRDVIDNPLPMPEQRHGFAGIPT